MPQSLTPNPTPISPHSNLNNERWKALMGTLGFGPSLDCYDALMAAYSEKHRFYHTAKHIDAMLSHFDATKDLAERPAELELAIWFHDAVYKVFSKQNELDSAVWAKRFVIENGYDREGAERIFNLIMATLHNGAVETQDQQLMVDIDLTILGTAPDVYDEFERNVRREYRLVPAFIYRKKRKALLSSFLSGSSIYNTDFFKSRYESAARANIQRAINQL